MTTNEPIERQLADEPYIRKLQVVLQEWRADILTDLDIRLGEFIEENPDNNDPDIVFEAMKRFCEVDEPLADWAMGNSGFLSPIQNMKDILFENDFTEGRKADFYVDSAGYLVVTAAARDCLKAHFSAEHWQDYKEFLLVRES